MNQRTIAQRLRATLAVIIGLLLVALALVWWLEWRLHQVEKRTAVRREQTLMDATRLRYVLQAMSDAVRDVADPAAARDTGEDVARKKRADTELDSVLNAISALADQYPELSKAAGAIKEFHSDKLQPLEDELLELATSDPTAAKEQYQRKYVPALHSLEQLADDLEQEVHALAEKDEDRAGATQLVLGVAVLIIIVVSVLAGRRMALAITEPLAQLLAAMESLRAGDFTRRLALPRQDEFGMLADGLNSTADRLGGLIGQIQRTGIQVNSSVTEMAATLKEQQASSSEVASTTLEIGATAKEITATARELGKTVGEVATVSAHTARLAGSGQAGLSRLESTMRQILEAAATVGAKLAILNENTGNISAVVTTINKVADQTNLLSLNAAIEAEKAGEYGQGFSVVATEVRRLADQTAVATHDIEQMVKEMLSAVTAGVMGMDKFNEEVRRGCEEARQVTAQLLEIIEQVQAQTPRFEAVNDGMQSQATAAGQISDALGQLGETTQQSAEAGRQNAEAIEQLSGAARGLQEAVSRFNVG